MHSYANSNKPDCLYNIMKKANLALDISDGTAVRECLMEFDSRKSYLLHRVQTSSGAHLASYSLGTGGSFSAG
jgi:hypothetical protein